MTTWYVDLDASYTTNIANSGVATNSPLGGVAGIQRIVSGVAVGANTFAAAETINIKYSTGDNNHVAHLIRLTVATGTTGTIAAGDTVHSVTTEGGSTEDAGAGHGTVVWAPAATPTIIWIEAVSGTWATDAGHYVAKHGDEAATHMDGTISAVAYPGIKLAVAGTTAGRCKIVGCDAAWAELAELTFVALVTTECVDGINGQGKSYWELRHISLSGNASGHNVILDAYNLVYDCIFDGSGGDGYESDNGYNTLIFCQASNNGGYGFNGYTADLCINCIAKSNLNGFLAGGGSQTYYDCLAYDNTRSGLAVSNASCRVIGSVVDGNTRDGILISGAGAWVYGCRITNNSVGTDTYYGLNSTAATNLVMENYNVFHGNGLDVGAEADHDRLNVTIGTRSDHADDDTEQGYTTVGSNIFTLTSAAIGRRISVALPDGLNTVYITAGLTPAAFPPPAGEVVTGGTAYEGATGAVAASGSLASSIVDSAGAVTAAPGILDAAGARTAKPGILDAAGARTAKPGILDAAGARTAKPGILDGDGVASIGPGLLDGAGAFHDSPGILETAGTFHDSPGILDTTGTFHACGVMTGSGAYYAEGVLESGGTAYYPLTGEGSEDSQPYLAGDAARLVIDVAAVNAELANMTTTVQNLLDAGNDGALDLDLYTLLDDVKITLNANLDEMIPANTDIQAAYSCDAGTAVAGGGVGVRYGGALRGA